MARQVSLKPSARRDFDKMPRKAQEALARKIDLLSVDPQAAGEALVVRTPVDASRCPPQNWGRSRFRLRDYG